MNFREGAKGVKMDLAQMRARVRESFVSGAYQIHSGIVKKFYSASPGSPVGLARRTGQAAKSWKVSVLRSNENVTCSIYSAGAPYADFSVSKWIRPKKSKWLVIPVGPALTKAGAARYPGNEQGRGSIQQAANVMLMPPVRHGFQKQRAGERNPFAWIRKNNSIYVVAKPGVKGPGITKKDRLLFVLKRAVKKPAKTAGLIPWVNSRVSVMIDRLSKASVSNFSIGE